MHGASDTAADGAAAIVANTLASTVDVPATSSAPASPRTRRAKPAPRGRRVPRAPPATGAATGSVSTGSADTLAATRNAQPPVAAPASVRVPSRANTTRSLDARLDSNTLLGKPPAPVPSPPATEAAVDRVRTPVDDAKSPPTSVNAAVSPAATVAARQRAAARAARRAAARARTTVVPERPVQPAEADPPSVATATTVVGFMILCSCLS